MTKKDMTNVYTKTWANGNKITYQEVNGTYYHAETSEEIRELLETIRQMGTRCRFHWGNTKTGQDYGDRYGVTGTIGRSTGTTKIPLLIANKRSLGGNALLDNCIVKITTTKGKRTLYQHPNYTKSKNKECFDKNL